MSVHSDFGDGTGTDGLSVVHAYTSAGAKQATVTATDAAGNQSSQTQGVDVVFRLREGGERSGKLGVHGGFSSDKGVYAAGT